MASPDVASRANDDGENDDAWCVGGFRVFGARTSPLRQKRGPLSVHDFLRASAAASDAATDRTPLGRLLPGTRGFTGARRRRRGSVEAAKTRRRTERAAKTRPRGFDPPRTSPRGTPVPVPVPDARARARLRPRPSRGARASPGPHPRRFRVRHPPRPRDHPPRFPHLRVRHRPRAPSRAREANGIRTIHPQTPTVERKPSETIVSKARAVDVDFLTRRTHPRWTPRVARRRHRRRLAVIVVQQWKWFAADALETLPARMHREWRTRRETVRAWRRVARDGTDGTAVDENEAKADKSDAFARARRRASRAPRRSYFGNRTRATTRSRVRASRARAASHNRARLLAPTLPGVARRDVARAASTRCAARAPKVSRRRRGELRRDTPRALRRGTSPRRRASRGGVGRRARRRDGIARVRGLARDRRARTYEGGCRVGAILSRRRASFADALLPIGVLISDSETIRNALEEERHERTDRVVVSMATRSWAAWVAYASGRRRAKGRRARPPRFSRCERRDAWRAWRFESLGVARLARARDARVTRTVTNRWRATAKVSARARSEAETRFATIRLATPRAAATWRDATRARARERVVERLADAHASRLRVFSRFTAWVARASRRFARKPRRFGLRLETTTRRCVGGWRARTEYKRRRDALRRVAARHRHDASRRFAFRGWRDVADVEWNRRERRHLAREHRRRARLISAFARWSGSST